ncbi:MAG: DNA polymerase I, partial [Armatimonadetes bacterium]|nr:DNA polymerase I [Armatimonadota bacterium]
KLIQDWGSVEQIIESLPQIEEKFRKKIIPGLEQIPKSKWLATIDRHVPIEWDFASLTMSRECVATAKAMLESLEMKTHVRRFDQIFGRYIEGMEDAEPIAEVALETLVPKTVDSPRNTDAAKAWIGANPVGLHAAPGAAQTDLFGSAELLWFAGVGDQVASITPDIAADLFREIPGQVVAHDAKKYQQGTILMDTLLAGYVLQSGRANYTLRDLAIAYLDVTPPETPEQQTLALVRLEQVMAAKLTQEHQLNILTQMEQPLAPVLAGMERAGIKVSREYLEDFSRTLAATIETSTATIYELAGQTFLIGSPKQLGEILFEKLGIPGSKKTKTGYATGAEILQLLAAQYPICAEVMTWRELSKLKSTYADSLPKMIAEDGRIHTNYNQTVAATGRLSSESPNLQNIPIRTELGRKIRRAFTAADGFELASFDYSQIELRLLAHMCEDVNLVEAFRTNSDVHAATAALTFNVDLTEVTKEQRRYAKVLNFAVLYGVTDFGLAQQLGGEFSISEAKELIRLYNERFPAVKAFTESVVAEARKTGYTTTLLGRRRYFPDIHAANRNERMYAERQAMNAPIQGSAADMIKLAMIDVAKLLVGKQTKMLLQVHDELVFELHPSEKAELLEPIRDAMVHAMPLNVPVGVDAKIGNNWEEMVAI